MSNKITVEVLRPTREMPRGGYKVCLPGRAPVVIQPDRGHATERGCKAAVNYVYRRAQTQARATRARPAPVSARKARKILHDRKGSLTAAQRGLFGTIARGGKKNPGDQEALTLIRAAASDPTATQRFLAWQARNRFAVYPDRDDTLLVRGVIKSVSPTRHELWVEGYHLNHNGAVVIIAPRYWASSAKARQKALMLERKIGQVVQFPAHYNGAWGWHVYSDKVSVQGSRARPKSNPRRASRWQRGGNLVRQVSDKTVIWAFLHHQEAQSKKLTSTGSRLDGNWMGGRGIAEWIGGTSLQFDDLGSRAAQSVQRAVRKAAGSRPGGFFKANPNRFEPKGPRLDVGGYDEQAARELELFADNDLDLYRQMKQPIEKNLLRKIAGRRYNYRLAPKAWGHFVEAAAKKYAREFATAAEWSRIFPPVVRGVVAGRFARDFEQKARDGEFTYPEQAKALAAMGRKSNPSLLSTVNEKTGSRRYFVDGKRVSRSKHDAAQFGRRIDTMQTVTRGGVTRHYAEARNPHGKPWTIYNTRIDVHEERDNLDIVLYSEVQGREGRRPGAAGGVIGEWHDDDARSMFDNGFFKARDLHGSVVAYANYVGLRPTRSRGRGRRNPRVEFKQGGRMRYESVDKGHGVFVGRSGGERAVSAEVYAAGRLVGKKSGGGVRVMPVKANSSECRRCKGARQVKLGPRMVSCPICCRKPKKNPTIHAGKKQVYHGGEHVVLTGKDRGGDLVAWSADGQNIKSSLIGVSDVQSDKPKKSKKRNPLDSHKHGCMCFHHKKLRSQGVAC